MDVYSHTKNQSHAHGHSSYNADLSFWHTLSMPNHVRPYPLDIYESFCHLDGWPHAKNEPHTYTHSGDINDLSCLSTLGTTNHARPHSPDINE